MNFPNNYLKEFMSMVIRIIYLQENILLWIIYNF